MPLALQHGGLSCDESSDYRFFVRQSGSAALENYHIFIGFAGEEGLQTMRLLQAWSSFSSVLFSIGNGIETLEATVCKRLFFVSDSHITFLRNYRKTRFH